MAKSKLYPRIFFSILFILIIILVFFITRPFLPAFFTGAIIAYLSYPFYRSAIKYIKNQNLASFVVAVLIGLLFTIPFILIIGLVSQEAYYTYETLNRQNLASNFIKIACKNQESLACRAVNFAIGFLPSGDVDYYMQSTIERITGFIIENASRFLLSVPSIMLNFFVMLFVIYYLLKDGKKIAERLKRIIPLQEAHKHQVFDTFHSVTYGVFYGNILLAIVQGLLGIIGFALLGVPSPVLWGFVMMLFALIPYFGTAIIWLPAALNLIFTGVLSSDNLIVWKGLILILYGIFIISTIDNILKPRLIGKKANIHPVLVLLGILGGLNLFGFLGIVLGPIMLALLVTFIEIYEKERHELERMF